VEKQVVTRRRLFADEAKVTLIGVADTPGVAADIFGRWPSANINVDMIVQSSSRRKARQNIVFTCPRPRRAALPGQS
jgi:aspartate kinase